MRIKIKFCGITNLDDAISAASLGADALGFVFYPQSARYISPNDAANIIEKLPPFITTIGLFVDQTADEVKEIITLCELNLLQFHGDEDEPFCSGFNLPYIKAISMKSGINLLKCEKEFYSAKALLLDTYADDAKGGTGKVFDWNSIPSNISKPLIIAGGLNPINVKDLLELIHPYAVDVSGGIERSKGLKDYELMKNFILGVTNASL